MIITVSIIIQYEPNESETLAQNIRCSLGEEFINEARRIAPKAVIEAVTSVAPDGTYSYLENQDTRPTNNTRQKVYGTPCR
jgi:hypothetical protein